MEEKRIQGHPEAATDPIFPRVRVGEDHRDRGGLDRGERECVTQSPRDTGYGEGPLRLAG